MTLLPKTREVLSLPTISWYISDLPNSHSWLKLETESHTAKGSKNFNQFDESVIFFKGRSGGPSSVQV